MEKLFFLDLLWNQDDGLNSVVLEVLTCSHQRYMPVFVLYHSIVLIFNNFNGFIWFNNSKHFHFLFPEVLPSLAVLQVFFESFLLIHRWRLLLTRSGGNSIFNYVSIQQDFISFLSAEIARQKKTNSPFCWSTLYVKNFTHLNLK